MDPFEIFYLYRNDVHAIINGQTPSLLYNHQLTIDIINGLIRINPTKRTGISVINFCFLLGAPREKVKTMSIENPDALNEQEMALLLNMLLVSNYRINT